MPSRDINHAVADPQDAFGACESIGDERILPGLFLAEQLPHVPF
jgi:hypothetical protein